MIRQGIDMGKEATIKVHGLFRSHDGDWSAMVPADVPYDTRCGHDHRRRLVRRPVSEAERIEIIAIAQDNGHDAEMVKYVDGKEYRFTPAVELERCDADLAEQDNLDQTQHDASYRAQ